MDNNDNRSAWPDDKQERPMLDAQERPMLDNKNHPALDDSYQEETAAELTAEENDVEKDKQNDQDVTSVYGWIAVALSVISFFIMPLLLAAAGMVVGFIARNKDATILGNTAIGIAIISLISYFLIIPMI